MVDATQPLRIEPARDPRCPICGSSPAKAAERLNRGVMLGTYVDADQHIWNMSWIPQVAA